MEALTSVRFKGSGISAGASDNFAIIAPLPGASSLREPLSLIERRMIQSSAPGEEGEPICCVKMAASFAGTPPEIAGANRAGIPGPPGMGVAPFGFDAQPAKKLAVNRADPIRKSPTGTPGRRPLLRDLV